MLQWQDREADLRWATMSVQLATNLRTLPACVVSMTPCMIKVGLNAKSMHVCLMGPCGKTRLMTNVRVPFPRSMGPMMLLIVMLDMKLLRSVVLGRTSARPYLNSCPSVGLTYGAQA